MGGSTGPSSEEEVKPLDVKEIAQQMLKTGSTSDEAKAELLDTSVGTTDNSIDEEEIDEEESTPKLGGHPAWQEILSAVPAEYHEQITPKLKEWDAGVTRRFQEIHSQYEPLKVFEPLADEVDADTLSSALGLLNAVNQDPESVYRALGEAYGLTSEQESSDDDEEYSDVPPQIMQQLQEQQRAIEALSEFVQGNQATVEQEQQQEVLDNYLDELEENYGEFDEEYVITKMAAGVDGEVAVRQYLELVPNSNGQQTAANLTPPRVLGSSGVGRGGTPSPLGSVPDVNKLGRRETKDLVEEILRASTEGR